MHMRVVYFEKTDNITVPIRLETDWDSDRSLQGMQPSIRYDSPATDRRSRATAGT